ncbi:scarecrow-like transcription factor PAT1 [Punica granatum]|uniref:Scarecrow-like transcription factor PAT1 n=2 Tax=Punica granatum TaxID=22663 RepID=A0A6P8DE22_PUNGR|nr:scarecrow-like transcription factor PAT1 [Punica granatum]XP_031394825.1 scarecrow-like transcription factor PAT1 [Punica granatum]
MPKRAYCQVKQEFDPYLPQFHALDRLGTHFYTQNYLKKFCTLDSSSASSNPILTQDCLFQRYDHQSSPEDHTRASSISGSCLTDESDDFKHKLRELETVMLGPDDPDIFYSNNDSKRESDLSLPWRILMDPISISFGDLKQVLIDSAKAVSEDDLSTAQRLMGKLRGMVSVSGEPIQRLGAYMLEGLVARLASSGSSIYKALRGKEPESTELLSYMHILYEVCPYFKFGYMSANGAIAEAMKDEKLVHIVDFQIGQGSQWITLIQAFAARPGGAPHIRITGLDDSTSAYARGGGLEIVGKRLSRLAESFGVPFEFHAVTAVSGRDVEPKNLCLRPNEALAVNFAFVLHHMPDESVSTLNHRDRLLRMVKGLSPKVVTLVEQESNTNTAPFFPRFVETLNYYTAMFESIDVTLPREHKERINVEQHCLARDVVNIIACEGAERVERHELLGKWRSRFSMAGFSPYPLSSLVNSAIKTLLENYSYKYRLEERGGALYLGWMDRDLVASSAWK